MRRLFILTLAAIFLVTGMGIGLTMRLSPTPASAQGGCQTFPETGKTVCGRFLAYWQTHGGLAQQGYPISNEFVEVSDLNGLQYQVQYFERAVFELHTENQPPNDVLLSQLGTFQFKRKYPNGDTSTGGVVPSPTATKPPAATNTPLPTQPPEQPITLQGHDSTNSTPFNLRGGTYEATWQARLSSSSCYFGADLNSTDNTYSENFVNTVVNRTSPNSGSTYLYNVPAGQFFLSVSSTGCTWTVTFTHR